MADTAATPTPEPVVITVTPTPPTPAGTPVVVVQKKWYQSREVIFNTITFISLLGVIFSGIQLPAFQVELITVVVAAANVALRVFFTGAPVTDIGAFVNRPK